MNIPFFIYLGLNEEKMSVKKKKHSRVSVCVMYVTIVHAVITMMNAGDRAELMNLPSPSRPLLSSVVPDVESQQHFVPLSLSPI